MKGNSRPFWAKRAASALVCAGVLWGFVSGAGAEAGDRLPEKKFELAFPGTDRIVDYEKYGHFVGPGTPDYRYVIDDPEGLKAAAGEGVYPNADILRDPAAVEFTRLHAGLDSWTTVGGDPREAFYAWANDTRNDEGTRLFYIAEALRRGGLLEEALKAYHALVVHFPRTTVWSPDGQYYWYAALEAISISRKICATYPELGMQLDGAMILARRAASGRPEDDEVSVFPGKFVPAKLESSDLRRLRVVKRRGEGKVVVVKLENGHWQLRLRGKPFTVRGITYTSTKVGESAHNLTLRSWMTLDDNHNDLNDGMFDSWIDSNGNGRRDAGERVVGDARLLKDLGVNAIRFYHVQDSRGRYDPTEYDKPLMRRLAKKYGIYFVMGDFLGAYTIGSGAAWEAGTDYTNPAQRERMLGMVRAMVMDHRDEPYVLMWLLGNENQHAFTHTNAGTEPEAYAKFVNEAARLIHSLDPDHPVAVGSLNTTGLEEMARYAPEVDIYGANVYAGAYSMGSTVQTVNYLYDRPLLFTEWGSDGYFEGRGPDEDAQAEYIASNWKDMELHMAGNTGEGNVIGGILFEWMDEWWKSTKAGGLGAPDTQETAGDFHLPFADKWAHEEWYGLMSQGDGRESPFLRVPRKAYFTLRDLWRKKAS